MANSRVLVGFSFVGTTLAAVIALFWYWNKRGPDQNRTQKNQKDGDPVWVVDDQATHPELSSPCEQIKPEDDIIIDQDNDDLVKSVKISHISSHNTEAEINQNNLEDDEYSRNICREVDDAGITRNRNFLLKEETKPVASEQNCVPNAPDKTIDSDLKSQADAENKIEESSAKETPTEITVTLDSKNVLKSDYNVVPQENVAPVMTQVTVIENELQVSGAESICEEPVLTIGSDSDECCEKSSDPRPVTVSALLISDNVDPVSVPESLTDKLEYVVSKETTPVETYLSSDETVTDLNGKENSHEAEVSPAEVMPVLHLQGSVSVDSLEMSPEPEGRVHLRSQSSQNGSDISQSVATVESSSTESFSKGDNVEHVVTEKEAEVTESLNDLNVCNDAESEEENQSVVPESDCDKPVEMSTNEREPSQSTESGLSRDSLEPVDTSQHTAVMDEAEADETPDNDSGLLLTPTDPNTTAKNTDVAEKAETPSNNCDNTSEASNDSGKGASVGETIGIAQQPELSIYQMDFPTELCGRLIGRYGKNINYMKEKTGAIVTLRNNPFSSDFQICTIEGLPHEIEDTLTMIRQKFPKSRYPNLQLTPNNMAAEPPVVLPDLQMNLPHGVSVDVIVSSIVNAGLVFLQQPTHPTFPSLERLNQFMLACYTQDQSVPQLPRPVEAGVICAAPVMNGWYRALVVDLSEDGDECDIKFVDYGGYSRLPVSHLRQIRSDFMTLPFQAVECYMANITPIQGDMYFNSDGATVLEELTQGKLLQAQVVGRAEDGIPFVHIYQVSGNKALFVNREMVNRGVARWIERL